jgi:hypothetical protein
MSWLCRLLAIAAAFAVSSTAAARDVTAPAPGAQHVPGDSVSYSTWSIAGRVVRLQVALPVSEAAKLAGPHQPPPDAAAVSDAVAAAFGARSAGGPCTVVDQGEGEGEIYRLALTPGIDRFEMIFLCASPDRIAISDKLLFDRVPGHINFARVQVGANRPFAAMFTRGHRDFDVRAPQGVAALLAFAKQGALNLRLHADLLLALAGIALFCAARRDLLAVVAGIAAGEGIAAVLALAGAAFEWPLVAGAAAGLFVAGLGAAALRSRMDDTSATRGWKIAAGLALALAIGGAILAAGRTSYVAGWAIAGACLTCLAMLWGARAPGSPHWLAWFAAAVLGILSGMTIATKLAVLSMPPAAMAAALVGWMAGVTIAATAIVAAVTLALWLIERWRKSLGAVAKEITGAGLVGMGLFWFVSRVWT